LQTATLTGFEFLLCVGPHVIQKHSVSLSMFLYEVLPTFIYRILNPRKS